MTEIPVSDRKTSPAVDDPFAFARMAAVADAVTADPILALIAKEEKLRDACDALSDKAILLRRSASPELRDNEQFLAEIDALYERADALGEEANKIFDQIIETRPITIGGAAEKFKLLFCDPPEHYDAMLADLRALAAQGGAA